MTGVLQGCRVGPADRVPRRPLAGPALDRVGAHRRDRLPQRCRRARRPGGKLMHAAMPALFVIEGIRHL